MRHSSGLLLPDDSIHIRVPVLKFCSLLLVDEHRPGLVVSVMPEAAPGPLLGF